MAEKVQEVCNLLNNMEINYKLIQHKAVYTIDEMQELNLPDTYADAVAKNLFVRDDKKQNYYLLVVRKEKKVELKILKEKIGSRPLSFASVNDLNSILGLSKGSVTPFGIINDEERKVKVILDKGFNESVIGIHPNENIATIWLNVSDLVKIIKEHGNTVGFVEV
jgi:Ala-tRNA(Pro) deacylase